MQAFSSGTKTLAEGGFTPPEHRKKWGPRKVKLSGADNAAMIGCQGYYEWKDGRRAGLELNAYTARDIALEQCPGAV